MQDGIYYAQFEVAGSAGAGVAVKRGNKVTGGDSSYWWSGSIVEDSGKLVGQLEVKQHTSGVPSVFGFFDSFPLGLTGRQNGDAWQFVGTTPAAPGRSMRLNLRLLQAE